MVLWWSHTSLTIAFLLDTHHGPLFHTVNGKDESGWMISTYHIQEDPLTLLWFFSCPNPWVFKNNDACHTSEIGAGLVRHLPGRLEFSIKLSMGKITAAHGELHHFHRIPTDWLALDDLGRWDDWTKLTILTILHLRIWSWASFPTATTLTTWQGSARTWVQEFWGPRKGGQIILLLSRLASDF